MISFEQFYQNLATAGNANDAIQMSAYMKNKFPFFGIKSPLRKELQADLLKESKSMDAEGIEDLVLKMWQVDQREMQYIALDLLKKNQRKLSYQHLQLAEYLVTTKSWWDTVDALATNIIGHILKDDDQKQEYADYLMLHDDMWMNRCALIFQLKYKDKTDLDILSKAIQTLKGNKDFFIQKAIGWGLRQYSKLDPQWVANEVTKQNLEGLAKREASKYL